MNERAMRRTVVAQTLRPLLFLFSPFLFSSVRQIKTITSTSNYRFSLSTLSLLALPSKKQNDLAKDWIYTTNIYEVNLRQYTDEGTFNAFAKHLPRLKKMGVETLWFMPITPISEKEKKGTLGSYYACSDYTSINPEF